MNLDFVLPYNNILCPESHHYDKPLFFQNGTHILPLLGNLSYTLPFSPLSVISTQTYFVGA